MRALNVIFLVLFGALCVLPLAERRWQFVPDPGLRGAVGGSDPVPLSAKSYFDGSFQKAFEDGFNAALGFRSVLVRSDNELNFRVFAEFAPSPGTAMILGKKGFIYERKYIDDYNRRDVVPAAELEREVQRLKLLQDYAASHDSTLLVVISPNKAALYPEYLPEKFVFGERLKLTNNYQVFLGLLQKYGVNFLDAQQLFSEWKGSSPFSLFASTGAHWNDPSVCDVTSRIDRALERLLQIPMLELSCEPSTMHTSPERQDRDLADLANLWSEESLFRPTPYAVARVASRERYRKPSVLFVGSSFVWQILGYVKRFDLQRRDAFYYYYKTRVSYPDGERRTIDPKQIDWQEDVFRRQAIVIEINSAVVEHVGWGFLEDAERAIRAETGDLKRIDKTAP